MIIRDPLKLNDEARSLWIKQEGLIIVYNLPFRLFETNRTEERQKELFEQGVSKTLKSNHMTGDAWDVVKWGKDGWSWKKEDIFWYQVLGILTLSLIEGLRWGADWNGKNFWFDENFQDYAHWERILS
jgi:peptidoglycan L-alanyl-D-glutamate endopeptidase CwlK